MGSRALLDLEIYCPWSAVIVAGQRIKPHKLAVMRCGNGTLFSICTVHRCRIFTADWNLIQKITKSVNVLEVTHKPLRRTNRGVLDEPSSKTS